MDRSGRPFIGGHLRNLVRHVETLAVIVNDREGEHATNLRRYHIKQARLNIRALSEYLDEIEDKYALRPTSEGSAPPTT